jgi:hypothetical protein
MFYIHYQNRISGLNELCVSIYAVCECSAAPQARFVEPGEKFGQKFSSLDWTELIRKENFIVLAIYQKLIPLIIGNQF